MENNAQIENKVNSEEIEENSYSKYMLKKLKRAKKKGIQNGITIPDLKYQLEKPDKERVIFKIIGYTMLCLSVLFVVGIIVFYAFSGIFSVFFNVIKQTSGVFDTEVLQKTLGFSSIAALGAVGLYILLAFLILVPVAIAWVLIAFTIKNFSLSKISRQEMAEGFEVKNYITGLFVAMIISLVCVGLLIFYKLISAPIGIIGSVVCALIFATSLILVIFLLKERKKEKEWFKTLSQERQDDFKSQNDAILHLKRTLKSQKMGDRW